MKELYSFEVTVNENPVKVILKKPSQRELEEGDEQYAIALSYFMRRGIMNKYMLHRQISDFGGILPEKVAKEQSERYNELYDLNLDLAKDSSLPKEKQDNALRATRLSRFMELKREIAAVEQVYNQAYNHTAEKRSETRLAMWWFYKLIFIQRKDDPEPFKYFDFESYEENQDKYHELVEEEDALFESFRQRTMGLIGFWLNSEDPTKEQLADFDETILDILGQNLDEKVENGPEESDSSDKEADKEFDKDKVVEKKPKSRKKASVEAALNE